MRDLKRIGLQKTLKYFAQTWKSMGSMLTSPSYFLTKLSRLLKREFPIYMCKNGFRKMRKPLERVF